MEYARDIILELKTQHKNSFSKRIFWWIKQNTILFLIINIVVILMILDVVLITTFMNTLRIL